MPQTLKEQVESKAKKLYRYLSSLCPSPGKTYWFELVKIIMADELRARIDEVKYINDGIKNKTNRIVELHKELSELENL